MSKKTREKNLGRAAQKRLAETKAVERRKRLTAIGVVVAVLVVGVGAYFLTRSNPESAADRPEPTVCPVKQPPVIPAKFLREKPWPMSIDTAKNYTARIATTCGTMEAKLFAKESPITVNNFVNLADDKFYNGVKFHRIANSIDVIQTGDPSCNTDDDECGSGGPGYEIDDELNNGLKLEVGSLAMANAGPNTGGSQFFIVTGEAALELPPNYTIFGKVTRGLDVAERIQTVPVGGPTGEKPLEDVWILSIKPEASN